MIPDRLSGTLDDFYWAAIAEHPALDACREFERIGLDQSRTIVFRSPLNDQQMDIQVWVSGGDLSISFGQWHIHAGFWPMTNGLNEQAAILLLL